MTLAPWRVTCPLVVYHHESDGGLPAEALDERWNPDDIELRTVGIDIGSSTSHLMFSTLHLRRLGRSLSTRYVVVSRETIHRSPIVLTPYRPDQSIDAEAVGRLIGDSFEATGLRPEQIESGAVILTGEAIRRVNARALADMVAERAGRLVCASAGHNLEALLAAHGSGAVEESRRSGRRILHADVGGGTSKLALIEAGRVLGTAAVNAGGRLVALDADRRVVRIEPAARELAADLGLNLRLGAPLHPADREALVSTLLETLLLALRGESCRLMLTPPLKACDVQAVTLSGGVAEYVYGRTEADFGDLGRDLGMAIAAAAAGCRLPGPLEPAAGGVRATVLGASQHTVQVSGDTLSLDDASLLPLRNLPVLQVHPGQDSVSEHELAEAIAAAYRRLDLSPPEQQVAVYLDWDGTPSYANLRALAGGLAQGLRAATATGHAAVLVFSSDVGRLVGELCRREFGLPNVVSIDSVELRELDFIDIGQPVEGRRVLPVVVKSLVFEALDGRAAELAGSTEV